MSVEMIESPASHVVNVRIVGKLHKEDYEQFVPAFEQIIGSGQKPRLLVELHDFHGWTAGALWEDLKFDAKHWNDIERVAIVGESKWQEGMAYFCKPFTGAKVKYFDYTKLDEARNWIES